MSHATHNLTLQNSFICIEKDSEGIKHVVVAVSEELTAEIDARNHWREPEELTDAERELETKLKEYVIAGCVKGFGEIFHFCYSGASGALVPINTPENLKVAFRRFVAITRTLFPELLQDRHGPLSQARVAALLGKSPTYIADVGTRFSENWKFYSRVQKTQSEKEASRIARLAFLAEKRNAPKVERKPNGKAVVSSLGYGRVSSPSSSH